MSTVLDPHSPADPAAYDRTIAFDPAEVAAAAEPAPPPVPPPGPAPAADAGSARRVLAVLAALGVVLVLLGAAAVVLSHRGDDTLSAQVAAARRGGLGSKASGVNADQLPQDGTPTDLQGEQPADPTTTVASPPTTAPQPPVTVTVLVPAGGDASPGGAGNGNSTGTTPQGPGAGAGSGNGQGNGNTGTTTPPKPTPQLVSFSIPSQVDCNNPANQTPYIPVSWTTKNATEVTLAIDGPGLYKSYPGANGSDTVPFACAGPHTYTIVAKGPGGTTTKQVKVSAKPKVVILPDNPKVPKLPDNVNVDTKA